MSNVSSNLLVPSRRAVFVNLSRFHDEHHAPERGDVFHGIPLDADDIGFVAGCERAYTIFNVQGFGVQRSNGSDGVHWPQRCFLKTNTRNAAAVFVFQN